MIYFLRQRVFVSFVPCCILVPSTVHAESECSTNTSWMNECPTDPFCPISSSLGQTLERSWQKRPLSGLRAELHLIWRPSSHWPMGCQHVGSHWDGRRGQLRSFWSDPFWSKLESHLSWTRVSGNTTTTTLTSSLANASSLWLNASHSFLAPAHPPLRPSCSAWAHEQPPGAS